MAYEYLHPEWAGIDPAEVSEYLREQGFHVQTDLHEGALRITTDGDASAALAAFEPTSTMDRENPLSGTYVPPLPPFMRDHVQHLRDYRNAVRGGSQPTNAQTAHAVADLIDAVRYLNARLTDDEET